MPKDNRLTWIELNALINEKRELPDVIKMYRDEKAGAKRRRFLLRIHSRLNKLRAAAEREQIKAGTYKV